MEKIQYGNPKLETNSKDGKVKFQTNSNLREVLNFLHFRI